MGIIMALIIGGIVGWIASRLLGRDEGIIMSIVIGIVGAFIGGILSNALGGSDKSFMSFTWSGVFWSLIGSLILVAIMNAFSGRHHHTAA